MSQPKATMEQQPNAIDDLENELERFRREWLEELAAEKEKTEGDTKEEGSKTSFETEEKQKVRYMAICTFLMQGVLTY